jgi:MOSC domain-containing protein YiiM
MRCYLMERLVSINVGLSRDVEWRGKTVHTAIWRQPVQGRRKVRRLNIEGEGQGDLAGHGGEHRSVMVCGTLAVNFICLT